jgi:hypothetical protein
MDKSINIFYKVINDKSQYTKIINYNEIITDDDNNYISGGFNYTDLNNIHKYFNNGYYVITIILCKESNIYINNNINFTDKFVLSEIYPINEFIKINSNILNYKYLLRFVDIIKHKIDKSIYQNIIKINGMELKYINDKHITYELCLDAITQNPFSLQYIPKIFKTYELCLKAVKMNNLCLTYVNKENLTSEIFNYATLKKY